MKEPREPTKPSDVDAIETIRLRIAAAIANDERIGELKEAIALRLPSEMSARKGGIDKAVEDVCAYIEQVPDILQEMRSLGNERDFEIVTHIFCDREESLEDVEYILCEFSERAYRIHQLQSKQGPRAIYQFVRNFISPMVADSHDNEIAILRKAGLLVDLCKSRLAAAEREEAEEFERLGARLLKEYRALRELYKSQYACEVEVYSERLQQLEQEDEPNVDLIRFVREHLQELEHNYRSDFERTSQDIAELEKEIHAPRERRQKLEEGDEPDVEKEEISGPGDTMPKMEHPPFSLKVWLVVGFFGYGAAPGILELAGGGLSLTLLANGTLRRSHRQTLEQAVQKPGLVNELDQGLSVEIFSLPLTEIHDLKIGRGIKRGDFTLVAGRVRYLFKSGNPHELQLPPERSLVGIIEGISEGVSKLSREWSSVKEMEDWGKELSKQMESMETVQNRASPPVNEIIELASPPWRKRASF